MSLRVGTGQYTPAMATLRAVTTPNPETVFTPEVIGALALLQKEAPLEFQKHKARFKGHINLNDLSKIIAEERRKSFHVESSSTERISTSQGTSKAPKTTKSLIPDCPIDLRIPAGFLWTPPVCVNTASGWTGM